MKSDQQHTATPDLIGVHGRFDSGDRIAYGLYHPQVMEDSIANHIRQVMGDDSEVAETIRQQSAPDTSPDALESIIGGHPVWSVDVPDTIIQLDVGVVWRDRWDSVLDYTPSPDHEHVVNVDVRDSISAPEIDSESRIGLHYIDGQDMHLTTKLMGITTADSFSDAFHQFSEQFNTATGFPSNWKFEIFEIVAECEYDSNSFNLSTTK